MPRVTIDMPDDYPFSTRLDTRISDINYGQHVGHDTLISLLHEARFRYFKSLGLDEGNIDGVSVTMSDLAVMYRSQVFYGTRLDIALAAGDFNKYGCDFFYRVTRADDNELVLEAKTGLVFFDYAAGKVVPMPRLFSTLTETKT